LVKQTFLLSYMDAFRIVGVSSSAAFLLLLLFKRRSDRRRAVSMH